ncbi:MAG: molybdopterin-binding protein [Desulfobacterales bacterium]|nr:molybdopterin-binding protein [Desulfobacterales bacterium]
MKKVTVEKAVGMILAHDITRIVPGKFKGVGFKKGHVVQQQDIAELLKLGKQHLFVMNLPQTQLHENDAALRIASAVCGDFLEWTQPSEGKSSIRARIDGLLKVDTAGLLRINKINKIILSTLKNNFPCTKGQTVAGTRIIPLTIAKGKIERLEVIAGKYYPVLHMVPYKVFRVGAVVTGSEIYQGLIKDGFDDYVGKKVESFGSRVVKKILTPDDPKMIAAAIAALSEYGCDLILTTGGLSVDPDDVTQQGVRRLGAKIIVYGAPILPGAMFLYARYNNIPILGLPACVYYHSSTVYDLMLPRALAGEEITSAEIAEMGHGGLCLNCETCRYPVCPFGK